MRSGIGGSGKGEYLAVPAKIGRRLESEEGNPGDSRLMLVKKTLLPEARIPGRWWLSSHTYKDQSRTDMKGQG